MQGSVKKNLKLIAFSSSTKKIGGFWEASTNDARLGSRVQSFVARHVRELGFDLDIIDPREVSLPTLEAPYFYYKVTLLFPLILAKGCILQKEEAPSELNELNEKIKAADGIIVITAEYNHSIPPGNLSSLGLAVTLLVLSSFSFLRSIAWCSLKTLCSSQQHHEPFRVFRVFLETEVRNTLCFFSLSLPLSGIVCYSSGQFGGMRAAMALRYRSRLSCSL